MSMETSWFDTYRSTIVCENVPGARRTESSDDGCRTIHDTFADESKDKPFSARKTHWEQLVPVWRVLSPKVKKLTTSINELCHCRFFSFMTCVSQQKGFICLLVVFLSDLLSHCFSLEFLLFFVVAQCAFETFLLRLIDSAPFWFAFSDIFFLSCATSTQYVELFSLILFMFTGVNCFCQSCRLHVTKNRRSKCLRPT